jgi:hypothetical protein
LPGLPRRWVRLPLLALCPALPATPVIPEEQERDAIEDALEKDMNHYLIFLANAPNLRGRGDDHRSPG